MRLRRAPAANARPALILCGWRRAPRSCAAGGQRWVERMSRNDRAYLLLGSTRPRRSGSPAVSALLIHMHTLGARCRQRSPIREHCACLSIHVTPFRTYAVCGCLYPAAQSPKPAPPAARSRLALAARHGWCTGVPPAYQPAAAIRRPRASSSYILCLSSYLACGDGCNRPCDGEESFLQPRAVESTHLSDPIRMPRPTCRGPNSRRTSLCSASPMARGGIRQGRRP